MNILKIKFKNLITTRRRREGRGMGDGGASALYLVFILR